MSKIESLNKKAFKAGLWYTICNFIVRGINFLTTPLFTRLLTKAEYGSYANFSSWLSLLIILTTFDLYTSVSRAKFDYKNDLDNYISTIQILGSIITLICYFTICLFSKFFTQLFGMDMLYIHIMFAYILVAPAFTLLQAKHRQLMKYKLVSMLAAISTLSSVIVSVLLVICMDDKFMARVIGNTVVLFALCLVIYIYNLKKGRRIKFSYWRYCLPISVPLILHSLAGNILGTSDRIMIMNFCGSEETALYSVIYSCSQIVMMLFTSMNQAWSPWFYEQLSKKKYRIIKKATYLYISGCMIFVCFAMLIGPELVLMFGGKQYAESSQIMPPIMLGCFFWFLYTFFINTEIFYKKTFSISIRTVIGAVINVVGNLILIPIFGWVAAAYTTLFGYIILLILHSAAGSKLGSDNYFNRKVFFIISICMIMITISILLVYQYFYLRLVIFIMLFTVLLIFLSKNKNNIKNSFSKI